MGQYHMLCSPDVGVAGEYLNPHDLGAGLKMLEQSFTYGAVRAALAALVSRRPGNMPADCGYSTMIGRWAGHRILAIGDYADDDDLANWPFEIPLSELYGSCSSEPVLEDFMRWRMAGENDAAAQKRAAGELEEALASYRAQALKYPYLTNISDQMLGIIESGCSVRYQINDKGWRNFISVKALAERNPDGSVSYVPLHADAKDMEYYKRVGMTEKDWGRPPLDASHHNIKDGEEDQGQRRVWANLDTREFVDPIAFGESPTTAGVMRGEMEGGSAGAVLLSLFHPESRGGGDLDGAKCPIVGAWRNDRIVLTAEVEDPDAGFPDTQEVMNSFKNRSDDFVAGFVAANKY